MMDLFQHQKYSSNSIFCLIVWHFANFHFLLGDSFWLDLPLINSMAEACKSLFPVVKHAYTNIPMYPGGQIVFLLCSQNSVSVCFLLSCWILHPSVFFTCPHKCILPSKSRINAENGGFKPDTSRGAEGPKECIWLKANVRGIYLS